MTKEERKEYNKKWKAANRDKVSEYNKIYLENNKDNIIKKRKETNEANPDKTKEQKKRWNTNYYEKNKETRQLYNSYYYENNSEQIKQNTKEYYHNNKESLIEKKRVYQKQYQPTANKRKRERRSIDPLFKLITNISNLIRINLKSKSYVKRSKTIEIIGCSYFELKQHIESKWEPWMTWENYGLYNGELNHGWDIDHIIPSSSAINEDDALKLNNYINLQPLCSKINRDIKKDKIEPAPIHLY